MQISVSTVVGVLVALRKESVDRNNALQSRFVNNLKSLSARRAWIEIRCPCRTHNARQSLSARRAWIEITVVATLATLVTVALRKESVDRNFTGISRAD